jgi:hypothetical protein
MSERPIDDERQRWEPFYRLVLGLRNGRARALLEKAGYSRGDVDELVALKRAADAAFADSDADALAKAEAAIWAWYGEWSAIANVVVQPRGLRRALGLPPPEAERGRRR